MKLSITLGIGLVMAWAPVAAAAQDFDQQECGLCRNTTDEWSYVYHFFPMFGGEYNVEEGHGWHRDEEPGTCHQFHLAGDCRWDEEGIDLVMDAVEEDDVPMLALLLESGRHRVVVEDWGQPILRLSSCTGVTTAEIPVRSGLLASLD